MKVQQLVILFAVVLISAIGCQKTNSFATSNDLASQGTGSQTTGTGALTITLTKPTTLDNISGKVALEVEVTPVEQLKSLSISVNGVESKIFRTLPLQMNLDTDKISTGEIRLDLKSVDMNDGLNYLTVTLRKPGAGNGSNPTPGPSPGPGGDGVIDPTCMSNAAYDACIFWKNPVAQQKMAFPKQLNVGDDLTTVQTYGVKFSNQKSTGALSSNSIVVSASSGQTATPVNGKWKFPYKEDTGKSYVAQLQAYYWLTYQEQQMETRTGVFFAKNKAIPVNAYTSGVANNAYWDGTRIVLGQVSRSGSIHEMAMSAEVYLHEMGHANLQFGASNSIFNDTNSSNGQNCNTAQGCIGGINEGQADFHYLMMFPESTPLGETWMNSTSGLASRDVKKNASVSVTSMFSSANGQIHSMGAVYASILYTIYTDPKMIKADFDKLFSLHLQKLTGSTRFPEARDIFLADDQAFYSGKYATIITNAFNSRGVTP